jgi:ADP-ribose pyrophosphatase YjhB (NUDIX family)
MKNIRPNVLAIIEKSGFLLAQKGIDSETNEVFYRLLGGGIEIGELSIVALRREIQEELAVTSSNEKLLDVIENIFTYNGDINHEITFLYKADIEEKDFYNQEKVRIADKEDKYAEWVSVQDIKEGKVVVYPLQASQYL